jgi:hypothetical protein
MFYTAYLNNDEDGCKQMAFVPTQPCVSICLSIYIIGDICDCTRVIRQYVGRDKEY